MKAFNKYHHKRTDNWYLECGCLTRYEKQVFSLEFNFPTPKDKSLFFGLTVFTITLFYFEIAWVGPLTGRISDWK